MGFLYPRRKKSRNQIYTKANKFLSHAWTLEKLFSERCPAIGSGMNLIIKKKLFSGLLEILKKITEILQKRHALFKVFLLWGRKENYTSILKFNAKNFKLFSSLILLQTNHCNNRTKSIHLKCSSIGKPFPPKPISFPAHVFVKIKEKHFSFILEKQPSLRSSHTCKGLLY